MTRREGEVLDVDGVGLWSELLGFRMGVTRREGGAVDVDSVVVVERKVGVENVRSGGAVMVAVWDSVVA